MNTYSSTSFLFILSCLAGQRGLQIKKKTNLKTNRNVAEQNVNATAGVVRLRLIQVLEILLPCDIWSRH